MELLLAYEDLLRYVNRKGVLSFYGKMPAGIPTLEALTLEKNWHTGDADTDPWRWKDRAAAEHRLAFGCVLNGYKGFLSEAVYPLFYDAFRGEETLEERYYDGHVSKMEMDVYRMFEDGKVLSTADVRAALHATKKDGASAVDAALKGLQRQFLISVCGNKRKLSFEGLEYGWPANAYCLTELWAGDWLKGARLTRAQARERVLDHCEAHGIGESREKLQKALFKKG
ncbi:MAG: hypothetical protein LLF87_04430 [Eubacteriales bacterium]|nr:hypothetical protein [Eubacteriales bacterium]